MKKKLLLSLLATLLIGLFSIGCTEKYPKVIERPYHGLQNTKTIEIAKVVLTDSSTVLHIDAFFRPKNWIRIDSATYIQANGKKYAIQSADGIKLHEEHYMPESGKEHFTLTFPPLPKGTKSIDFIESDCDNCFKVWDIDLTGKQAEYKPQIPDEILKIKTDEETSLPQPQFKYGKTKATLYLYGVKDGYAINSVSLTVNNIMKQSEIEGKKETEGKYIFEFDQYITSPAVLALDGNHFPVILSPGEDAEIHLDLTAKSRNESRYHPQKELQYIAYKGESEQISLAFSTLDQSDINPYIIDYDNLSIFDLPKNTLLDSLFKRYDKIEKQINSSELTNLQKQIQRIYLKSGFVGVFNNLQRISASAYRKKHNLKRDEPMKDYTPLDVADEDKLRLKDINLNDSLSLYTFFFIFSEARFATENSLDLINKITGTKVGLMQDLNKNLKIIEKASKLEQLTNEEEEVLKSASNPYYLEAFNLIFTNTKKQYDDAIAAGGFTTEETPNVADDKILEAIISKYKGKPVFIDFWATWCAPCRSAMQTIKPIKPEMAEKGVISIYITSESSPKVTWGKMLPEIGGIHYYLNDKQWMILSEKHKAQGIPTYMIFDKSGKKVYQASGYPGNDKIKKELSEVW